MDLGLEEGLIVLDTSLAAGDLFELHLDIEAEWSVRLQATTVSSSPIFFGKQHLTRVSYRFLRAADRSMFGLWLQQQLAGRTVGAKDYLKPAAPNPARQGEEPVLGRGTRLAFVEDRWRRALATLKARIPWREAAPVPNDRRCEHRAQVGLALTLATASFRWPAELLNVSFSGACLFIESSALDKKGAWPALEGKAELVVPDSSLLMGSRRCAVETVWCQEAQVTGGDQQRGRAYGVRFGASIATLKRSFVGDLLRRLRYDPRQVRKELRFPLKLPVAVSTRQERLSGRTIDLSAGGARLEMEGPVATPGDGLIELSLPGDGRGKPICLSVRFLRQVAGPEDGYCYAVAFRKGQTEAHLRLSRWLASRMRVQTLGELVPGLSAEAGAGGTARPLQPESQGGYSGSGPEAAEPRCDDSDQPDASPQGCYELELEEGA
jgi:hypothetical protein